MGDHSYGFDTVSSFEELVRKLERVGVIESETGKEYDADEAEQRVDRIERYVEQHGGRVDETVRELVGDLTPAGDFRDTVARILAERYDD